MAVTDSRRYEIPRLLNLATTKGLEGLTWSPRMGHQKIPKKPSQIFPTDGSLHIHSYHPTDTLVLQKPRRHYRVGLRVEYAV